MGPPGSRNYPLTTRGWPTWGFVLCALCWCMAAGWRQSWGRFPSSARNQRNVMLRGWGAACGETKEHTTNSLSVCCVAVLFTGEFGMEHGMRSVMNPRSSVHEKERNSLFFFNLFIENIAGTVCCDLSGLLRLIEQKQFLMVMAMEDGGCTQPWCWGII